MTGSKRDLCVSASGARVTKGSEEGFLLTGAVPKERAGPLVCLKNILFNTLIFALVWYMGI